MREDLEPQEDDGFYAEPDRDTLVQFTIYELPEDFPKHYVIRRWEVRKGAELVQTPYYRLGRTLDEARRHLPAGVFNVVRDPNDPRVIVETWS